jgi:ribose 5-phosphate isomerase B
MKVGVGSDHGAFAMKQGVEDNNVNVLCFGGRITGIAVAWECTQNFLSARFSGADRRSRRLAKVTQLEAVR